MHKLVYWSRTGITERIASQLRGQKLEDYDGGDFVLMFPSYRQPRKDTFVPEAVQKFLEAHSDNLKAVIGVGNRTFGGDFCAGAEEVASKYNVKLLSKIDIVPTPWQDDKLRQTFVGE